MKKSIQETCLTLIESYQLIGVLEPEQIEYQITQFDDYYELMIYRIKYKGLIRQEIKVKYSTITYIIGLAGQVKKIERKY